jgi:hypothetical protein
MMLDVLGLASIFPQMIDVESSFMGQNVLFVNG